MQLLGLIVGVVEQCQKLWPGEAEEHGSSGRGSTSADIASM